MIEDQEQALVALLDEGRTEEALELGGDLANEWMDRARFEQGFELLMRALDQGTEPTPARARALSGAGMLAFRKGDNEEAKRLNREALELARRLADREEEARALGRLARCALRDEDFVAARANAEESVQIFQDLGDESGVSSSFHVIAYVTKLEGDYPEAKRLFEQSLERNRRLGSRLMESVELGNLGAVEKQLGNLDRAEELTRESVRIARALGNAYLLPYGLVELGGIAAARGELERGARLLGAGQAAFDATGAAMDPGTAVDFERDRELVRGHESAWTEGAALSLDEALDEALG